MRILFDQAVYDMRNKGNVALLQAALDRIHTRWPLASLEVLTLSPHLLRLYWPTAYPVRPDGQGFWGEQRARYELMHRLVPASLLRLLFELREAVWRRKSSMTPWSPLRSQLGTVSNDWWLDRAGRNTDGLRDGGDYASLVAGADLFIATGAQYMADACKKDALRVLDRLEAAHRLGKPTAMVGQGFGPILDPDLQTRAKAVLPLVDLIFVRERRTAPQLLASFGVDPARVIFTGDDAIEMAYKARAATLGTNIGVAMRVAHYTAIERGHLDTVKAVLHQAAIKHHAQLMAVPISHSAHELDDQIIRQMLASQKNILQSWRRFDTPLEIIQKVGRCRLVVTGTFHAAVFALAQGIPAVGLASSAMYVDKFLGLADQFGPGCQVVRLNEAGVEESLADAIDLAWTSAEEVRTELRAAAERQIALGQDAYRMLYELVESRGKKEPLLLESEAQ